MGAELRAEVGQARLPGKDTGGLVTAAAIEIQALSEVTLGKRFFCRQGPLRAQRWAARPNAAARASAGAVRTTEQRPPPRTAALASVLSTVVSRRRSSAIV